MKRKVRVVSALSVLLLAFGLVALPASAAEEKEVPFEFEEAAIAFAQTENVTVVHTGLDERALAELTIAELDAMAQEEFAQRPATRACSHVMVMKNSQWITLGGSRYWMVNYECKKCGYGETLLFPG